VALPNLVDRAFAGFCPPPGVYIFENVVSKQTLWDYHQVFPWGALGVSYVTRTLLESKQTILIVKPTTLNETRLFIFRDTQLRSSLRPAHP
jgi:hypothetical protein